MRNFWMRDEMTDLRYDLLLTWGHDWTSHNIHWIWLNLFGAAIVRYAEMVEQHEYGVDLIQLVRATFVTYVKT